LDVFSALRNKDVQLAIEMHCNTAYNRYVVTMGSGVKAGVMYFLTTSLLQRYDSQYIYIQLEITASIELQLHKHIGHRQTVTKVEDNCVVITVCLLIALVYWLTFGL